MSSLTQKQKQALNEAILEYLQDNGYTKSFQTFKEESNNELPTQLTRALEKKWTAIIALTKKVHDLQTQLENKESELKQALPFQYGHALANKIEFGDSLPNEVKFQMIGHRRAVNKVIFHPNTTWVASASDDCLIGIWDSDDGSNVKFLKGHTDIVHDISFNSNGTLLVSCSGDTNLRVWNLEDEFRCIKTLNGHDHSVTGVVFLRMPGQSNQIISCGRDGTIRLWDLESGFNTQTIRDAHGGEWVKKVCLSLDGSLLASAGTDKTVRIWDSRSLKCLSVLQGHEHVVECLAFSNQNTDEVVSGKRSADNEDNFEANDDENEQEYKNGAVENGKTHGNDEEDQSQSLESSEWRPRYLASGARDKNVIIWDLQNERPAFILKGHGSWVRSVLFHPCGKYLISCADDKSIKIWDLVKQRQVSVIENAHDLFISSIDWNPALEMLASASNSKDIKLWHCVRKKYSDSEDVTND